MKQLLKSLILGQGRKPRRIPFGLYRGIVLVLDPASESSYYFGTFERETASFLRSAIQNARSFLDVGAGGGELVAWALRQPQIQRAIAYDCSPDRWLLFWANMKANGFETDARLTAVQAAFAGDSVDDRTLLASLPEPILVKMDIDGGEQSVLERLRGFLTERCVYALIETHSRSLDSACTAILKESGYTVHQIPRAPWRAILPEQRPLPFNQWVAADNAVSERRNH